jgi:F-type H+-transporting ATPase subunit b
MWRDPMFWSAVAFAIFVALTWHYARKPAIGWLDSEIQKISDRLAEARALRTEAEAELATYKKKQAKAMADAEAIVQRAYDQAAQLKAQTAADLKAALVWHEEQAKERIRLAEAEALEAVRMAAVDTAIEKAREILAARGGDTGAGLADQAIAELPYLVRAEARAA